MNRKTLSCQFIFLIILFQITTVNFLAAKDELSTDKLFDLPFDELMNLKVSKSTLVTIESKKNPASVTTITSEQIQRTPFRNLYDLIEVYVPGALWMNHWDSPNLGIRGVISDRNNKILVLLNGRNTNLKARGGALSELENWNIDDIDRIEVIRGPGSVTYGPGAVAGVINIITKNFETNDYDGIKITGVHPYESYGGSFKYSNRLADNIDMFSYVSLTSTKGYSPDKAYTFFSDDNYGLLGDEISAPAQDYYSDYNNNPQVKLHLEFDYDKNTKLWIRYVNSGSTRLGAIQKSQPQIGNDSTGGPIWGDWKNILAVKNEHFYITLENQIEIAGSTTLKSMISFDSENNARREGYFQPYWIQDSVPKHVTDQLVDINSLRLKYNNFSENELLAKFVLVDDFSDNLSYALGTEVSYNSWTSPWFEGDEMIRMGDHKNIISSKDSPVYGWPGYFGVDSADAIFVNSGWSTLTYSFFSEVKYSPTDKLTFLMSGRLDKDSYSEFLLSPRVAMIYGLNENNHLKLIAQESNRMNTAEELYLQNMEGVTSPPEKLKTLEFIYNSLVKDYFFLNLSAFYNMFDVISWSDPIRSTRNTGNLSLVGAELDIKLMLNDMELGFSHSYLKQLKWELADSVYYSGISYSDYHFNYHDKEIPGVGNDLNNWSNHSTKMFLDISFLEGKLTFHIDSRIFWNFEGSHDGLEYVRDITQGSENEKSIQELLEYMQDINFYDTDFRLNANVRYDISNNFQTNLFFQNIIDITNNHRYKYDAGSKGVDYMIRTNAIAEPFTAGMSIIYKF